MFGLFNAIKRLVANVNRVADSFGSMADQLESRMNLDHDPLPTQVVIEHQAEAEPVANGRKRVKADR